MSVQVNEFTEKQIISTSRNGTRAQVVFHLLVGIKMRSGKELIRQQSMTRHLHLDKEGAWWGVPLNTRKELQVYSLVDSSEDRAA